MTNVHVLQNSDRIGYVLSFGQWYSEVYPDKKFDPWSCWSHAPKEINLLK